MNDYHLYKYRALGGKNEDEIKNREHIKEIFKDNKVWFSKPEDFNDPFEFLFVPSFDATIEEKIEKYARLLSKKNHNFTINHSKALAFSYFLSEGSIAQWEQNQLTRFKNTLSNTGIFSLTKNKHSILMWSHYANKHKGICIGFSPVRKGNPNEKLSDFWCRAWPVNYPVSNALPIVNIYKDNSESFAKIVFTKARCWKYEDEFRIIDMKNGPGYKYIPEGIISSVILGCKIEADNRKFIIDLASTYPTHVNLFEAHIKPHCYELEIKKLT